MEESISPNKEYILEAYRTSPAATVDFSVKVYRINEQGKKLIYNSYKESTVEIHWLNENIVVINGTEINLKLNETYDWRFD